MRSEGGMKRSIGRLPVALLFVLAAAYLAFGRLARPLGPCEGPVRDASERIQTSLAAIEHDAGAALDAGRMDRLGENARSATTGFRTCCLVLQAGTVDPEQFGRCRALAESVAAGLDGVATAATHGSAEAAAQEATLVAIAATDTAARALDEEVQLLTGIRPTSSAATSVGASEHEPNDTFASAVLLPLGRTVGGAISGVVDRDFFRFHGDPGVRDRARLALHNRSMTLAPQIILFDARKTRIRERYEVTPGADLDLEFTLEPDQDEYVEVLRFGRDGGDYELTVTRTHAADVFEPNDDAFTATPLGLGAPCTASVLDEHDADWYRVSTTDGAPLTVRLENRSTTLAPRLRVFDHNRAELSEHHSVSAGASLDLVVAGGPAETYYLEVAAFSGGGSYELGVTAKAR
jgi:hypothetical protein